MRTNPALFTGGILAASLSLLPVGTATAAMPAGSAGYDGYAGYDGSGIRGTVVSAGELNLRQQPTADSRVVGQLAPGSHGHVECSVTGQTVRGNPHWYWLAGVNAWASAAFIDTGGRSVPGCTDPCPEWKDTWNVTFG